MHEISLIVIENLTVVKILVQSNGTTWKESGRRCLWFDTRYSYSPTVAEQIFD